MQESLGWLLDDIALHHIGFNACAFWERIVIRPDVTRGKLGGWVGGMVCVGIEQKGSRRYSTSDDHRRRSCSKMVTRLLVLLCCYGYIAAQESGKR